MIWDIVIVFNFVNAPITLLTHCYFYFALAGFGCQQLWLRAAGAVPAALRSRRPQRRHAGPVGDRGLQAAQALTQRGQVQTHLRHLHRIQGDRIQNRQRAETVKTLATIVSQLRFFVLLTIWTTSGHVERNPQCVHVNRKHHHTQRGEGKPWKLLQLFASFAHSKRNLQISNLWWMPKSVCKGFWPFHEYLLNKTIPTVLHHNMYVCASIVQFPFLWIQWLIRVYPNPSYTISSNWRYKFEIFSKLLGIKHNIVAKQPPNVTWPNWTQFGS